MAIEPVRVTANLEGGGYLVELGDGHHTWAADEPGRMGGTDAAASPTRQLWGALGSCIAITLAMYANTKGVPLRRVEVEVGAQAGSRTDGRPTAVVDVDVRIEAEGLDDALRDRLRQVARRCPVHRILEEGVTFGEETVTFV